MFFFKSNFILFVASSFSLVPNLVVKGVNFVSRDDQHSEEIVERKLDERGPCENDPTFFYKGKKDKDCSWVSTNKNNCRKRQPGTGKEVKFYCPQNCKEKCFTTKPTVAPRGPCDNDPNFFYKGDKNKGCSWASTNKNNCRKRQPGTGKEVKFYCPQNCKEKCFTGPTKAPTGPTKAPTGPTKAPTGPTKAPAIAPRGPCENDPLFRFKGDKKKDCSWASTGKNNCRKRQPGTKKDVKFFCPENCKEKCFTDAPTIAPSTTGPTFFPTITFSPTETFSPTGFPTYFPTGFLDCKDDMDFQYQNNPDRTCIWVSERLMFRCKLEVGPQTIADFCRFTCNPERCE